MSGTASPSVLVLFLCISGVAQAQVSGPAPAPQPQATNATTDPSQARVLNSVFEKWNIRADPKQWNTTGDPCSGAAIDSTSHSTKFDDPAYNPFIICDCSYQSGTICHITQLKVQDLEVVGVIPDELWSLTSLTNLNLERNCLTGPLSAAIANLTGLQYFTIGINDLSGEIPKEIGQLTELRSLSFGRNNFSGSLPSELGNLLKLQQLYVSNCGVSGEIPPTFANLQNLEIFWARGVELSGRIPDFIGNFSKLTSLRFQGNSFEGPIPFAFSNLTSIKELHISDLSNANGSSSLAFIENMKALSILVLRNNNISDSIPSDFGLYQSLSQLDLSYNYLDGSIPSWVKEEKLQLNLVANNFSIESLQSSGLPSGLACLQRNFPCNRGPGIYYNFGINCGGPEITSSSDGIVYEKENEPLGPASYFVTGTSRWGVSNVGYFAGSTNPQYTSFSLSQFTNTFDSVLFQTARLSASSIRYFGLGLQNGNYTVNLKFAEHVILAATTGKFLGKRLFDIYIQGILVSKNFDILKEAGMSSFGAVQKPYTAHVSENYLEIHLFWAGKGTCCIPERGTYGPAIAAISATPDFIPTVSNSLPTSKKNRTGLIVGIVVGGGVILVLLVVAFYLIQRRKRSDPDDDEELYGIDVGPLTFSYPELKTATNDFDEAHKLGEGGFGPVYRGTLSDGRVIAVKQLSAASHQGKNQFVTEIATISAVQHNNLVKLYGFCTEGVKRLLVYEYLENNSLDQALFGERRLNLDWSTRFNICLGIARGLTYLHEESRVRIVHRDVKASNILLDTNLTPKISDFGLAKLFDEKKTHISTRVAGTIGYLAPEYAMRGHLTEKTDVFAFGVVALEIVSGRPNSDPSLGEEMTYLLEWAWQLHENRRAVELVDSRLSEFNEEEAQRIIKIGLLCTQTSPMLRPSMSRVVGMLSGDMEVTTVTSKPGYLTDWKFDDLTTVTSLTKLDGVSIVTNVTDMTTRGTDFSFNNSLASTSIMGQSPPNAIHSMSKNNVDGR
ncbi:probable LRR receptor-like serine/threonine-protein kinase At1g56130 isoform X3 [Rosa chinensis]|uniref:probable LRR receptor-like serine/threonine-protein kinase At1g56130 isoform X3 n=1 Tax=Rosa chinensis TaxID=74649 RepID=UPI001AD91BE6|nr:probable LRR receptor-like serine/threonine-protein kinase At1g56130 isoform X3 [Rosa chinensis]